MNIDLTEASWALVAELFEHAGRSGAPARYDSRHMVNACCNVRRTGCTWSPLRRTFPLWQATSKSFSRRAAASVFAATHERLHQQWGDRMGSAPEPPGAIVDAQSTRNIAQSGNTFFDAGKKAKRGKHHLVVDTLGLLLAVTVTAASAQDRDVAAPVECAKVPGLKKLQADGANAGKCATGIKEAYCISVEIVRHPGNRGTGSWQDAQQAPWPKTVTTSFVVQAKRRVVARAHG